MIKCLILVGGESSRMGEEKYLMEDNGTPQYQYLYEMLTTQGYPTYISCNERQNEVIPDTYAKLVDTYDQIGPIGGLATAIAEDARCSWLVVACDLMGLTADAVTRLISANAPEYDIVTYQHPESGFYETTLTIYNPGAFIVLKRAIRKEVYSLQDILKKCPTKAIKGEVDFLVNVNTREDRNTSRGSFL
ncbi:molybdenum cofactor guanylyltransferase [Marinoscillum sp.]|uniref:molybdenum cofactor guanylyltransferase n=1 Tax=Marinoscillum sp. TaxID=2024838 RepID=UPI003BACF084